tara:strand:- start:297 stop:476 length:180 start_codon:yes stop_codon:yes gene_type:complete
VVVVNSGMVTPKWYSPGMPLTIHKASHHEWAIAKKSAVLRWHKRAYEAFHLLIHTLSNA